MHPAIALVDELRRRGVELAPYPGRDRIRFRPKDAVTSGEVELLRRSRGIVLALLQEESLAGSPRDPTDKTDKRLDPTLLSVLSVFPGARLEVDGCTLDMAPFDVGPKLGACHACGSRRWWRLRFRRRLPNGAPWICERCNPPGPPTDQVEFVEVADA